MATKAEDTVKPVVSKFGGTPIAPEVKAAPKLDDGAAPQVDPHPADALAKMIFGVAAGDSHKERIQLAVVAVAEIRRLLA